MTEKKNKPLIKRIIFSLAAVVLCLSLFAEIRLASHRPLYYLYPALVEEISYGGEDTRYIVQDSDIPELLSAFRNIKTEDRIKLYNTNRTLGGGIFWYEIKLVTGESIFTGTIGTDFFVGSKIWRKDYSSRSFDYLNEKSAEFSAELLKK